MVSRELLQPWLLVCINHVHFLHLWQPWFCINLCLSIFSFESRILVHGASHNYFSDSCRYLERNSTSEKRCAILWGSLLCCLKEGHENEFQGCTWVLLIFNQILWEVNDFTLLEWKWAENKNIGFIVALQDALAVTELEKFTWEGGERRKSVWNNIYCGECGLSTAQGVF